MLQNIQRFWPYGKGRKSGVKKGKIAKLGIKQPDFRPFNPQNFNLSVIKTAKFMFIGDEIATKDHFNPHKKRFHPP